MYEDDEREMNLKAAWASILVKWRVIILVTVIGIVCGSGYGAYKNSTTVTEEEAQDVIDRLESSLSDDQVKSVENTYEQYKTLVEKRDSLDDYCSNAMAMTLNSESVYRVTEQYQVNSNVEATLNYLVNYKMTTDQSEEIAAIYDQEEYVDHISDIVTFSGSIVQNGYSMDGNWTTASEIHTGKYAVIRIQAYGADEETAQKAVDSMWGIFEANIDALQSNDSSIEVTQIENTHFYGADSNLATLQENNRTSLNTAIQAVTDAESNTTLTGDALSLYNALKAKDNGSSIAVGSTVDTKRYGAIGGIAAMFVILLFLLLKYVLSSKIHGPEDVIYATKAPVIAYAAKGNPSHNKFHQYVNHLTNIDETVPEKERIEMAVSDISTKAKKEGWAHLYIISFDQESADALKAGLEADGLHVKAGIPMNHKEAYNDILKAEAVVITEKSEHTILKELTSNAEVCYRQEIPIIGSLLVRDIY